jgi:alpha-N-arabinofuranosidase
MTARRRAKPVLLRSLPALALCVSVAPLAGAGRLWRLAPPDLDATTAVGRKPGVEVEEPSLDAVPATLTLAPRSVNCYEFPAR